MYTVGLLVTLIASSFVAGALYGRKAEQKAIAAYVRTISYAESKILTLEGDVILAYTDLKNRVARYL